MKVLLIDVNCKKGSTGQIVYDLYNQLNKQGHIAAIAYGRGPIVKEKNIFKFSFDLETFFHVLMNRITGIHGSFSFFSTNRLKKFIIDFKPDVIHIHELHGYFVNIVSILKFLKSLKIKIIWTFHCEYMIEGKGFVLDKLLFPSSKKTKEYPKSWFIDNSRFCVDRYKKVLSGFKNLTIITPSQWLKNKLVKSYLSGFQIHVIPNGINQEIFKPYLFNDSIYKSNITNDKFVVLAVAPNFKDPRKGFDVLLKIAARVNHKDVLFVTVGDCDVNLLPDNMINFPRTESQTQLAKLYSRANVFIITSKVENFPTTCIEALSCSTPIIGLKSGGTEETAPEPFGIFVNSFNLPRIIEMLNNLNLFFFSKDNRENAYKFALKNYSKEIMFYNYMNFYI
jgi:putative colanic acid biosynthesis glycosyltransferase